MFFSAQCSCKSIEIAQYLDVSGCYYMYASFLTSPKLCSIDMYISTREIILTFSQKYA